MGGHVTVIDVGGNVSKEFSADGIGGPVEDHQIHRHVVSQQEISDSIHRHLQGLILGVAVYTRGNQRESNSFTLMGQSPF